MSSRSLAAARARRSGESAPPVSGNRPVTSIGSVAQQHIAHPYNNVRTAKSMQPPPNGRMQQQHPHHMKQQMNQYDNSYHPQNQSQSQTHTSNGLPFSKLSISDAIGLITLRLGRVEQWVIDTEHEQSEKSQTQSQNQLAIPDNHKLIDSSVLTTMINRLDILEKNANVKNVSGSSEEIAQLKEEVVKLTAQLNRMGEDVTKHTMEMNKNNEQIFRFNRELVETKDILKSFMLKYDMFTQEITQTLSDYEVALGDIEKRIPNGLEGDENAVVGDNVNVVDGVDGVEGVDAVDAKEVVDLKSLVKQELANSENSE
jgi:hypothetical protein